jgi:hypothetical protein
LKAALSYIETKLPVKSGLSGKRVFIGEYGFPAGSYSPLEQDRRSRLVMRTGLEWGCSFILYWEMYNNEVDAQGKAKGFWLVNDQNVKQPVYFTHHTVLQQGQAFVAQFKKNQGRQPTAPEYQQAAMGWIQDVSK